MKIDNSVRTADLEAESERLMQEIESAQERVDHQLEQVDVITREIDFRARMWSKAQRRPAQESTR